MDKESRKLIIRLRDWLKMWAETYFLHVRKTYSKSQEAWAHISNDLHTEWLNLEKVAWRERPTSAGLSSALAFSNTSERVWRDSWYSSLHLESSDIFCSLANNWASLCSDGKYASDRTIVNSSSLTSITPAGPSCFALVVLLHL